MLRQLQYQRSIQATQPHTPIYAADAANTRVLRVLHIQDGTAMSVNVSLPTSTSQSAVTLPTAWYKRLRTLVSLIFLLMLLLTLFVQSGLADGTWQNISKGLSYLSYAQFSASDVHMASHVAQIDATQNLARISQLDPNQYNSADEYNTWAYGACSAAAMTEVFDAYGRHFRITDVLAVEARIGAITPQLGLVDPSGIASTAAQFGFKAVWSNSWDLDKIINIANNGKPVIVGFPPDRYDGGHLLVLLGGNSNEVYVADSSSWNHHILSRGQFLNWWAGFGAVVTPRQ
ncbi:MAG: hypothetical protein NVSMB33_08420 [Ktedonobacteraceae bacterium]